MSAPASTRPGHLDVSVIIVNFNVRAFLEESLRSVKQSLGTLRAEILVVDNHSVDGSCEMVRREFPEVTLIANEDNVGFARANNQAIKQARGRHLFILNPDTLVEESTVGTLIAFLDAHPDTAAAGCQILNPDGSFAPESRRAFPTPLVAFFRMTGLSRLFPRSRLFGRYNLGHVPTDQITEVDALSGSCMMVRRAAISYSAAAYSALDEASRRAALDARLGDITGQGGPGVFDEDFFMYGEDLDWCFRFQEAGWKIYYTPDTRIIHYKGESTKKNQLRYVRLFYGAMIRFAEKHLRRRYPPLLLWLLRAAVVGRGCLSALRRVCRHRAVRDAVLVFGVMAAMGLVRSMQLGLAFPSLFYWLIAPSFALIAVSTIGILGGYQGQGRHLGAVVAGVSLAVLLLSSTSFFVKSIAFSRAVVLASLPGSILALTAYRLLRKARTQLPLRTLFVGDAREAQRLQEAQRVMDTPPFAIIGYVPSAPCDESIIGMPSLGTIETLRDLVQAHEAQAVVFAAASLSNRTIFTLTRRLSGLPLETSILAQNHAHVIGKASVTLLQGAAVMETQEALGYIRSAAAHRIFDGTLALLTAAAHPWVLLAARLLRSRPFWKALAARTRQWPSVLCGRVSVVGYRAGEGFEPPEEWALRPGVFAVTESLGPHSVDAHADAEQVYWSYVQRQSALVDWLIVLRAIRLMRLA